MDELKIYVDIFVFIYFICVILYLILALNNITNNNLQCHKDNYLYKLCLLKLYDININYLFNKNCYIQLKLFSMGPSIYAYTLQGGSLCPDIEVIRI